jgi:hypothetical protein
MAHSLIGRIRLAQVLAEVVVTTVASTAGAAAVDSTKLAPITTLISSAAAAQLRFRERLDTKAFMGKLLAGEFC